MSSESTRICSALSSNQTALINTVIYHGLNICVLMYCRTMISTHQFLTQRHTALFLCGPYLHKLQFSSLLNTFLWPSGCFQTSTSTVGETAVKLNLVQLLLRWIRLKIQERTTGDKHATSVKNTSVRLTEHITVQCIWSYTTGSNCVAIQSSGVRSVC